MEYVQGVYKLSVQLYSWISAALKHVNSLFVHYLLDDVPEFVMNNTRFNMPNICHRTTTKLCSSSVCTATRHCQLVKYQLQFSSCQPNRFRYTQSCVLIYMGRQGLGCDISSSCWADCESRAAIQSSKSYPRNRSWRPIGLWDVTDPTLSR
jgi:hypothetical protein